MKGCVKEEERLIGSASSSSIVGGRLEQLNLNTQTQPVCVRYEVDLCYGSSSSRMLVAACFEVVVDSGRSATTTSWMFGVESVQ